MQQASGSKLLTAVWLAQRQQPTGCSPRKHKPLSTGDLHFAVADDTAQTVLTSNAYNGGEVVISQDHITGFLGNFCASDAHGYPNICQFQGRCIVHTISRHGCNVAHLPQKPHNVLHNQLL